jgi:B9 domain-containing protein 2
MFQAKAVNGWPKVVFVVWKVDDANKIDVCKRLIWICLIYCFQVSYGMLNLPRTTGYHEVECNTWTPYGDFIMNN